MAYNNKIPNIGKTVQSVRDTDFISITEVKAFDELINEIVSKLSVISDSNSSVEDVNSAINIAQEIKKIEFNMADAIKADGSLDISSTPDPVTGEIGGPNYGPNSMDKMLIKLDDLYNRFTKLVGEHGTEWKIDLDNYYNSVYSNFKNTINSIFGNSVNIEAIEGKENTKFDYTKRDAIKLRSNQIMRLNPDVAAYPRNVNVMLSTVNTDTIVFEVSELEAKNLVMNLRFFNGTNYFSYNVVIDDDELFVIKEESFKFTGCIYTIKIFKYTVNDVNRYVVTLASDCSDINTKYSFKIEGLLVGSYDFSTTGFNLVDHKKYYEYVLVDKTEVEVPVYDQVYWFKEDVPSEDSSEETSGETIWKSITNLRVWDDKEYYIRKSNFTEIGKIIIGKEKDSGTINIDNKDISGKDVASESYPTVVNNKKYVKPLYYTKVDIDSADLFKDKGDREKYLKNHDFYHFDKGTRFINDGSHTYEMVKDAREINGKKTIGLGSKICNIITLKPNRYVKVPYFKTNNFNLLEKTESDTLFGYSSIDKIKSKSEEFAVELPGVVELFVNKTVSSNGIFDNYLTESITNLSDTDPVIDGMWYFKDTDGNKIVIVYYNTVLYYPSPANDKPFTDISIFKFNETDKIWVEMTKNNLVPIGFMPFSIDGSEIDYQNVDISKIKLVADNIYNRYFDYITNDNGIHQWMLEYNDKSKEFVNDSVLSDMLVDLPYIETIDEISVLKNDENLYRFDIKCDNNDEKYTYFYNSGDKDVFIPELVCMRNQTYSTEDFDINFTSTSTNDHLVISTDNEGKLWYSTDGIHWKLDERIDYTKYNFAIIEWDRQYLWFALSTDKKHLYYSENGYTWLESDINSIMVDDEEIVKYTNVAINRYFIGTTKYAYVSEDGKSWDKTNIPTGIWRDMAWNTKKFVCVGSIGAYQALDPESYETLITGFTLADSGDYSGVATYDDNIFVICGTGGIKYSKSNYLTESETMVFSQDNKFGVLSINTYGILNNNRLFGHLDDKPVFINSKNEVCYGSIDVNAGICVSKVCYSSSLHMYVAVSYVNKGFWYSRDGRFWIQSDSVTKGNGGTVYWDETLSLFIGALTDGLGVYWSTDGMTWTKSSYDGSQGNVWNFKRFQTVIIGARLANGVIISTDGKTWTKGTITSSSAINDIIVSGDDSICVASGDKGMYYLTDPTKEWTKVSGIDSSCSKIAYNSKKFYSINNSKLIMSSDGITWSTVDTTLPIAANGIATNDEVLIIGMNGGTGTGIYYSIDEGLTWNKSDFPSSSTNNLFAYIREYGKFYTSTLHSTSVADGNNTYWSTNGKDWFPIFTPIDQISLSENAKIISTQAEDITTEDVIGYFLIWDGPNLYKSREGSVWQKITYNKDINDISFVGEVGDRDVFLTFKDGGIRVSTRNTDVYDAQYSTYGESFNETSIDSGDYGIVTTTLRSDANNHAYIAQAKSKDTSSIRINYNKNSYTKIQRYVPNQIGFIGDTSDDEIIVVNKNKILQYDKIDNIYTPAVCVGNREVNFAKTISDKDNVKAIVTNDSVIFASDTNNDLQTIGNISISDIVSTSRGVFGINSGTGLVQFNKNDETNEYTLDEVFADLAQYSIYNIFEDSSRSLYFMVYKDGSYTIFRNKISEKTFESIGTFKGSIKYLNLIDDKIVLLAHGIDSNNNEIPSINYFYDNSTGKIVENELIDVDKIINFSDIIEYKNEKYVINTIESTETSLKINFGKLIFNDDGTISLNVSDNGIFTFHLTHFKTVPKLNSVVIGDKLYFTLYGELTDSGKEFFEQSELATVYEYSSTDTKNGWELILSNDTMSHFIREQLDGLLIKDSSLNASVIDHDESKDYYKLGINETSNNYKIDRVYFDKETKGMTLGKYHSQGIFKLYTEMLTAVKSKNNINVALALGPDAKIALYDKEYDFLRVLNFKYKADINGAGIPYYLNVSDSDEAVITNIYSGNKNEENYLYFVVKDKFLTITHDDFGKFTEVKTDEVSYRLFKVAIEDIKTQLNNNVELIDCEWVTDITEPNDVNNVEIAFKRDGIAKTNSINIENHLGCQFIVSGVGSKYDNVDSTIWFNVNTSCLMIVSRIVWDTDINDIIDNKEDINSAYNYTKTVVCEFDKNKVGKYDDNGQVSSYMILNTNSNGDINQNTIDLANNDLITIGKRVYSNGKTNFVNSSSSVDDNTASRYPTSFKNNSEYTETTFVPRKIIETDRGAIVIDNSATNSNNSGYVIDKRNNSIKFDKFSDGNNYYYNNAKQTKFGLFRWFDKSISYKPTEYPDGSENQMSGWLYFTPKNGGNTIVFDMGFNKYVTNIWETYAGIFIAIVDKIPYGQEEIVSYGLYRLKCIPVSNNDIIQFKDSNYFQECDCGEDPVIDVAETSEGIFMINFFQSRTRVYRWNGDDFYCIRTDLNYTEGIKRCFDTSEGVWFIGNKKEWGIFKYEPTTESLIETSYKVYLTNWMDYNSITNIETERGIYVCGTKTNTDDTRVVYDLKSGKSLDLGTTGAIGLPREISIYPTESAEFNVYNNYWKKLAEMLVENYNLPIDVWIKTVGNIVINNVIVPIKAVKIVSGEGVGNLDPDNVIFALDNDARFNVYTADLVNVDKSGNLDGKVNRPISKLNFSVITSEEIPVTYGGGGLNRKIYRRFSLVYPITTESWMAPQEFYTEVNDDNTAIPWTVNNNHNNNSYFDNVLTKNHLLYGTGIPIGIKVNVGNPYSYDDGSELSAPMDFKYPYWINTSNDKGVVTTHWYVENGYIEVVDDRYVIKRDEIGVYKNFLNGCRFERMIIDFNNDFVDYSGYVTEINNENRGKTSGIREFIHMCNRFKNNPDFPSSYNYAWNYYYAKRKPYRIRDVAIALNGGPNQLFNNLWNNDHTLADKNCFDCTKWTPGSLKLSPTILMYNCITTNSFCDWIGIKMFAGTLSTDYTNNGFSFTGTYPKLYYEKVFDKRKFSLLCESSWKGPSIYNTASDGKYGTYTSGPSSEPSIDMGPYFFINDNWNPDKIGGGGDRSSESNR